MGMYAQIKAVGTRWEPAFTVVVRNIGHLQPIMDVPADQMPGYQISAMGNAMAPKFPTLDAAEGFIKDNEYIQVKSWSQALPMAGVYQDGVSGMYRIKGKTDMRKEYKQERLEKDSLNMKYAFEDEYGPIDWDAPGTPQIAESKLPPRRSNTQAHSNAQAQGTFKSALDNTG